MGCSECAKKLGYKRQKKIFDLEAHPAKVNAIAGGGVYGKVFFNT